MSLEFRERTWGTADGRKLRIADMELGHLVNVLNWVHDNWISYSDSVRSDMVAEANYRKLELFTTGQPYPGLVDGVWKIIDPETGKGTIKPPPAEYIEAVKDNPAYTAMFKRTQAKRQSRKKDASSKVK